MSGVENLLKKESPIENPRAKPIDLLQNWNMQMVRYRNVYHRTHSININKLATAQITGT